MTGGNLGGVVLASRSKLKGLLHAGHTTTDEDSRQIAKETLSYR